MATSSTRTADSSDRTANLPVARPGLTATRPQAPSAGFARRFISALMRSLAAPHI